MGIHHAYVEHRRYIISHYLGMDKNDVWTR